MREYRVPRSLLRNWLSLFIKIISLYNPIHFFLAIMYRISLANRLVGVGTRHSHHILVEGRVVSQMLVCSPGNIINGCLWLLLLAWIDSNPSKDMYYKVWYGITYPFLNFKDASSHCVHHVGWVCVYIILAPPLLLTWFNFNTSMDK